MIKVSFLSVLSLFFAFSLKASAPSFSKAQMVPCHQVTLRALDKITARVKELSVKKGEVSSFRALRIAVQECLKNAPDDPPETLVFLEIKELKPNNSLDTVFSGWMFASHPSLSALEHPVYDVWVKESADTDPSSSMEETPLSPTPLKEEPQEPFQDPEASHEPLSLEDPQEADAIAALYRGLERSPSPAD